MQQTDPQSRAVRRERGGRPIPSNSGDDYSRTASHDVIRWPTPDVSCAINSVGLLEHRAGDPAEVILAAGGNPKQQTRCAHRGLRPRAIPIFASRAAATTYTVAALRIRVQVRSGPSPVL